MITNINYLKTALECLEQGQTPVTELKILKTIQQICEQNIQRIELNAWAENHSGHTSAG